MKDFFDLIQQRESCRNYNGNPVEQEKLTACLNAARLAPSACNSQPYHLIAVTNPALAKQLAACTQSIGMNKFTSQCPAFVVITEEKANLSSRIGGLVKSQEYAQIDIGIAAAHLCLAATEQGISTCILGWFDEKAVKALLGIPSKKRVRLIIAMGYAANSTLREKKRKPLEELAEFRA